MIRLLHRWIESTRRWQYDQWLRWPVKSVAVCTRQYTGGRFRCTIISNNNNRCVTNLSGTGKTKRITTALTRDAIDMYVRWGPVRICMARTKCKMLRSVCASFGRYTYMIHMMRVYASCETRWWVLYVRFTVDQFSLDAEQLGRTN